MLIASTRATQIVVIVVRPKKNCLSYDWGMVVRSDHGNVG